MAATTDVLMDLDGLNKLVETLIDDGYEVHGPQVNNGVIVPDQLRSSDDLPIGITDEQSGGSYRLLDRSDDARFGYAVGPKSWKDYLHPARSPVWSMTRTESGELHIRMHQPESVPRAFLGVRPCELAAILKQDRVLLDGPHPDPTYGANREQLFLVAVNCGNPASTCFCSSMGTGPSVDTGYDLVLTELVHDNTVNFVVGTGSSRGAEILSRIETRPSTAREAEQADQVAVHAVAEMERELDTTDIKELLYENLESSLWDSVADRCLTCANCTLACPTCFCTDLVDVTDLSGDHTDRWRTWDSCFSLEYSRLGPAPQRATAKSRYRQWLVHKLGSWIDQFDESGCVGCGRCITWCPVGIDLTAEVDKLQETRSQ